MTDRLREIWARRKHRLAEPFLREGRRLPTMAWIIVGAACLLASVVVVSAEPEEASASEACVRMASRLGVPWRFWEDYALASPASALARGPLWTPPYPAAEAAARSAAAAGDTPKAQRLRRIAAQPRAVWFTDPTTDPAELTKDVAAVVRSASSRGQVPVLVTYAVPLRDCGGESSGGARSGQQYAEWLQAFAAGLRRGDVSSGPGAVVIIEPDALALLDQLPAERQTERLELLRAASIWFARVPGVSAYLDAGHSQWVPPGEMIRRLSEAGVGSARGFSLNVSNFGSTEDEMRYGEQIAPMIGWKHFVIDTSRNGNGSASVSAWCNPPGRALGQLPQVAPSGQVDGFLWIKPPGESDGSCGSDQPPAGVFWPQYAEELARAAGW